MAALAKTVAERGLRIGMIPGDGIGKVVLPAAQRVLLNTPGIPKPTFVPLLAGFELFQSTGTALPQETVDTLRNECSGALFGAVSSPSHKVAGYSSPIVKLRKELDLYANVRPINSVPGTPGRQVEITVVRENTECLYVKMEEMEEGPDGKVAWAKRRISERASRRIGTMAAEVALRGAEVRSKLPDDQRVWKGPPKVTIVHKSNVLSTTDGLFRETVRSVFTSEPRYSSVTVEEGIVDSLIYNLFRTPEKLNVLVCPNLYGDIVSDAGAALVGSLGLVPSVNAGDTFIMGEPVHGSAPDIASATPAIANPVAAIRSAALMLEYMGFTDSAAKIYDAVNAVLRSGGASLTPDLGGKGTTEEVTELVLQAMH